jgi:serine/threonine protein kinase
MAPPISKTPNCPRCGEALPADSVGGLCPRCLMVGAMQPTQAVESAAPMPPLTPEQLAPHFPQLEILECLGRGGMGVVYKARQKSLNRLVALKLLAPERVTDAAFADRFTREAHALAALNHPHIVAVHDFGKIEPGSASQPPLYFLLMEFVDGVNLRQAMKAGRFTPEQALAIVPPVCEALQYAHDHGIVHRDIKPENLLLDKEGRVKIADFGIAKMLGESGTGVPPENAGPTAGTAEPHSIAAGTPHYMAPEQKAHRITDHRADIYSLGVVLYEMLTGELPEDKLQPPSRRVHVDVRIDEIVLRALETKPELRFATAAEFRTQVETLASPTPPMALRNFSGWFVAAGLSLLLMIAALTVLPRLQSYADAFGERRSPLPGVRYVTAFSLFMLVGSLWLGFRATAARRSAIPSSALSPSGSSRLAIAGACWVPVSIVALIVAYFTLGAAVENPAAPRWWQQVALVPLLILAVAGPFGTTILGWLAVADIVRSRGKVHGLHLAVFDGLVYPLMALSGVIAMAGVALAKMFVDFYSNPSASAGQTGSLVTRAANWFAIHPEIGVFAGVVAAIAIDVLIVRAVMRAVRKEVTAAPPERSATGNQARLASLALIFALISTALGAFAAMRNAVAWPVMTLAFVFAGATIIMALPVRRLAAGKSALIVVALGMFIWPLAAYTIRQANTAGHVTASGPEIERVDVSSDLAVVKARGSDDAGMIFLFGTAANRWTPGGLHLEAMFDVTLTSARFERGVRWNIKPRHGTYSRYRLDGPPGPILGKIAFHPGARAPEADGSYVIGEFRPDEGEPLPIAVRLESDKRSNSFPTGAHISRNHHSVMVTHDQAEPTLHYVLYYAGDFGTTSSGTQNLVTNTWVDEGSVKLKSGRTFGYRRVALYPDELHINGTAYDLRKGRVLVLHDDGTLDQVKSFPALSVARDPEALAKALTPKPLPPPERIDFKVLRVENPPGTRDILLHFERDSNYGLAIEVWQDVTRLQGGPGPAPDQRDWRQKEWVGVNGPRVLRWVLPLEFTPDEAKALAKEMERKWKGTHPLPDGAVPEFAAALHRDGWKYHLGTKVLREPGSPRPPAPAGALFTAAQRFFVPR